ncbi:DNA gyrase inhibitor YacG [Candidatus Poribacteria bacterium]|nr:DNA gyrase inhibitor YacG [Candidatus Poribacteria bacterium]
MGRFFTHKVGDLTLKHKCSVCGTVAEFDYKPGGKLPPNFPFCSARCKSIDLGKWFGEEYKISAPLPNADLMADEEKEALAQFLLDEGEVDEITNEEE